MKKASYFGIISTCIVVIIIIAMFFYTINVGDKINNDCLSKGYTYAIISEKPGHDYKCCKKVPHYSGIGQEEFECTGLIEYK